MQTSPAARIPIKHVTLQQVYKCWQCHRCSLFYFLHFQTLFNGLISTHFLHRAKLQSTRLYGDTDEIRAYELFKLHCLSININITGEQRFQVLQLNICYINSVNLKTVYFHFMKSSAWCPRNLKLTIKLCFPFRDEKIIGLLIGDLSDIIKRSLLLCITRHISKHQ